MGLEASLKLLDLPPDAAIDDANQAYAYLTRMVDLFHQGSGPVNCDERQADMELLTCAYEKAVAYLSDRDPQTSPSAAIVPSKSSVVDQPRSTNLHSATNLATDADKDVSSGDVPALPGPNARIVEDAISITSRRLHRTESALMGAQQKVASATAAATAANRRLVGLKQANITAVVDAKSAKTRMLLLEIEAKRAMEEAITVAEKARDRVVQARKAAREARDAAKKLQERARRVGKSERTAAAQVVCSEDQLEKAKACSKELTHTLIQTRSRMKVFQGTVAGPEAQAGRVHFHSPDAGTGDQFPSPQAAGKDDICRQQIMADLLEIEACLNTRDRNLIVLDANGGASAGTTGRASERRQHHRIIYPIDQRPLLSMGHRSIPILDLSTVGMRLEPGNAVDCPCIVRGSIAFAGQPPVKVTGKVVRQDEQGLGLKLVTRISNHILDQERLVPIRSGGLRDGLFPVDPS